MAQSSLFGISAELAGGTATLLTQHADTAADPGCLGSGSFLVR